MKYGGVLAYELVNYGVGVGIFFCASQHAAWAAIRYPLLQTIYFIEYCF